MLIGVIDTVLSYLAIWRKRINYDKTIAEIQQKLEREIKSKRNFLFSTMVLPQFLMSILLPRWGKKKLAIVAGINFWQLWQWHCWK